MSAQPFTVDNLLDYRFHQEIRKASKSTCDNLLETHRGIHEAEWDRYQVAAAAQYIEYLQRLVDAQHHKLTQFAARVYKGRK
jgi:hypothetical protein